MTTVTLDSLIQANSKGYTGSAGPNAISNYLDWTDVGNPSTPGAGVLRTWAKNISGRSMLKQMGPSGLDTPFQPALFGNNVILYAPASGTTGTGTGFGTVWVSNGTVSHPTPTSTSITSQMKRTRYANVVTTTNQQLGPRTNVASEQQFWMGNAAGLGGFFFFTRFIIELIPASTIRLFAGLTSSPSTSVVISDTVLANTCGLWHDTTDGLGVLNFVTKNAATANKNSITLTGNITAGQGFDFYMFAPAGNAGIIYYRLDDINAGTTLVDSSTSTDLPVNTAFMQPQVQMSNGTANLVVTTTAIGVNRIYVESDH